MKRPVIWSLAFLCTGIASGLLPFFHGAGLYFFILLFSAAALFTAAICFKYRWLPAAVFFLFFLSGFLRVNQSLGTDPAVKRWANEGADLRIAGYVLESALTNTGRARIVFDVYFIEKEGERHPVRMRIIAVLPGGRETEAGEGLILRGPLSDLDWARNPGAFNEFLYYKARKIHYKCFPEIEGVSGKGKMSLSLALSKWRQQLSGIYESVLPHEEAGIVRSVVLGDRSGLEETTQELYKAAGIYHLLCVSGLHVSILSLLIYRLLGLILEKRRAGVINLALLILYCIFTGSGIATVRAVIMAGIVIAGDLLFRGRDLPSSVSFAAVCMLLFEPLYIIDAGFQMSFSAVFGIATLTAPVERLLSRFIFIPRFLRTAASGNLAAIIGTFPVLLFHFYVLTTYAFFANLIILPTSFILVGMGVITGGAGIFSLEVARFLAGSLYLLLRFYRSVCELFSRLPAAEILAGSCGLWTALCLGITALMFAYWFNGKPDQMKQRGRLFLISLAIAAAAAAYHYRKPGFEITMLDVGQGDAFVIRQNRRVFVLDGGGLANALPGGNTGARVLVPYLNYLGVNRINGVFVSHPDSDHAAGIIELLPRKRVDNLYFAYNVERDNAIYQDIEDYCHKFRIPISYLSKDDILTSGEMRINTVYPAENDIGTGNESCLVLQFHSAGASILFTGDIGGDVEKRLSFASPTVLKLSHHGSKHSNGGDFLRKASPALAIVSTGRRNVYGHPSQEVKECLKDLGIPLYDTAERGAVTLTFHNNSISVKTMINETRRTYEGT